LHAATVIGDTVGDPSKDTSSAALNPILKFTTLFGLLAVELAISLGAQPEGKWFVATNTTLGLSAVFFLIASFFIYQSFYGMRIKDASQGNTQDSTPNNPAPLESPSPQESPASS
jgi:K(+)-stimulated pyrophosphate-energized sodium pump